MHGGATGTQHLLLAETLGLAMARRASDILERHRASLTSGSAAAGDAPEDDDDQFAVDNAIFTAVLDAANECLGRFDSRPADDRWCDALLQVIHLAQLARLSADGLPSARLSPGRRPRPWCLAAWRRRRPWSACLPRPRSSYAARPLRTLAASSEPGRPGDRLTEKPPAGRIPACPRVAVPGADRLASGQNYDYYDQKSS